MSHPTREQELAAKTRFDADTTKHQMTVLHDDGLYRHLLFKEPGSSFYWFEVITYPGALTLGGDMGTWTFRRTEDMFEFFRDGRGLTRINPGYWGEKLQGGLDSGHTIAQRYDDDRHAESVNAQVEEFLKNEAAGWPDDVKDELRQEVKDQALTDSYGNTPPASADLAYEAARLFRFNATRKVPASRAMTKVLGGGMVTETYRFDFYSPEEWSYKTTDDFFLWACWAIVHAIASYDAHKKAEAEKAAEPSIYKVTSVNNESMLATMDTMDGIDGWRGLNGTSFWGQKYVRSVIHQRADDFTPADLGQLEPVAP